MLKFEGKFSVGDRIRAYDFEPRVGVPDRFVEGVITEVGNDFNGVAGYVVKVDVDSVFTKNPREEIIAPYECLFMEFDGRIVSAEVAEEV